jgi:hypothetical protein
MEIKIYNLTFQKIDKDGEPVKNTDGSVKQFAVNWHDNSHLCEGINLDDLIEVNPK